MGVDIFCIEGSHGSAYRHRLEAKGFATRCVSTGRAGLTALKSMEISHGVLLNAYSMNTSGARIAIRIKGAHPELPVVHITDGLPTSARAAEVVLAPEASLRIVVNRFELFSPFEHTQRIQVGALVLDEKNRRVKTPDGVSSLTPKLTALLKMLMVHAGDVVERDRLYRTVWETEYVGDIRSLHVHIKMLRDAIGGDARAHRCIETVWGKGYRLKTEI